MLTKESATIRKLPAGDSQEGILSGYEGNRLQLTIAGDPALPALKPADLVEITSARTVYLGEVLYRKQEALIVGVEHSIDRAALSAIQQVWNRPNGE